ncbi:MAG: hypothetical protein QXH92_04130 [Candidatus Aenigmatarchaeota archaeon]
MDDKKLLDLAQTLLDGGEIVTELVLVPDRLSVSVRSLTIDEAIWCYKQSKTFKLADEDESSSHLILRALLSLLTITLDGQGINIGDEIQTIYKSTITNKAQELYRLVIAKTPLQSEVIFRAYLRAYRKFYDECLKLEKVMSENHSFFLSSQQ